MPLSVRSTWMPNIGKGLMCSWRRWLSGMKINSIIGRGRVITVLRMLMRAIWDSRLEDMRNCWVRQIMKEFLFSIKLLFFLRKIISWGWSCRTGIKIRAILSCCVSWLQNCSKNVTWCGGCRRRVKSCEGRLLKLRVSWMKRTKRYDCWLSASTGGRWPIFPSP